MSYFGGLTDHFGLAGAAGWTTVILTESSKKAIEQQRADALDENGDIAQTEYFGNDAGTLYDVSCTYVLKSGTFVARAATEAASYFILGELTAGTIVESFELTTSNSEFPTLTLSGKLGAQTVTAPSGKTNKYYLPTDTLTLTGAKIAQGYGFSVSQGKLTGCSISGSLDLVQQDDGTGEPAAHGIGNGVLEVTVDLVRIAASAPSISVTAGFGSILVDDVSEGQAAFHTAQFKLGHSLVRGTP